ncbi:uncharacterized protein PGTG_19525 [Puccinia graminis f. sp. tritici CRL 75-36-700-3]|uniref:Uncharacterized protein n=1 Tax=Puccinia graminis f. sp. tritici (strain CRL 75-36-700-3 / race SCCL) TaxID=418459 RepID=E3LAJ6_PUCGT|nr:uncharacterized protein PGTG_19525 [Puccinia graminis f. sp. tritici CRL 75-36-700-3]EFP93571.1 hypothetical protein PGTG_19525 [Puccinia graminis f. sp. tritici CRL 75-36-700-3]
MDPWAPRNSAATLTAEQQQLVDAAVQARTGHFESMVAQLTAQVNSLKASANTDTPKPQNQPKSARKSTGKQPAVKSKLPTAAQNSSIHKNSLPAPQKDPLNVTPKRAVRAASAPPEASKPKASTSKKSKPVKQNSPKRHPQQMQTTDFPTEFTTTKVSHTPVPSYFPRCHPLSPPQTPHVTPPTPVGPSTPPAAPKQVYHRRFRLWSAPNPASAPWCSPLFVASPQYTLNPRSAAGRDPRRPPMPEFPAILWGLLKQDSVPQAPELRNLQEFYNRFSNGQEVEQAARASTSPALIQTGEVQLFQRRHWEVQSNMVDRSFTWAPTTFVTLKASWFVLVTHLVP